MDRTTRTRAEPPAVRHLGEPWRSLACLLLVGSLLLPRGASSHAESARRVPPRGGWNQPPDSPPGGEDPRPESPPAPADTLKTQGRSCTDSGCHDALVADRYVHAAIEEAGCEACHEETDGAHDFEPADTSGEVCLVCHDEGDDLQWDHGEGSAECLDCHDPHTSPHRRLLLEAPRELCRTCHDDVGESEGAASVHRPAAEGRCLACHHPHRVQASPYLRRALPALCTRCHRDKATAVGVRTDPHLALGGRACVQCHEPHQSTHARLLNREYSPRIYLEDPGRQAALCFSCHRFDDLVGGGQTGFRSAEGTNLHAIHVTIPGKGRSCRTCHAFHRRGLTRLVGDGFLMGRWPAPLHYERSGEEATCSPACHEPRSYPLPEPAPRR